MEVWVEVNTSPGRYQRRLRDARAATGIFLAAMSALAVVGLLLVLFFTVTTIPKYVFALAAGITLVVLGLIVLAGVAIIGKVANVIENAYLFWGLAAVINVVGTAAIGAAASMLVLTVAAN